ncbi:hypothetical protein QC823_05780 [Halomonas vilamensis]|uniref:Uncharacterized protein n=1 Tax=Vreelandella vilamensis TaxID=531309 RepID=A0ABU1H4C3_9GAMM|nr:hypothetical protein [Halomonas vilamensis]MDR5898497.1 hypothetical protein [Halomonas vilamensis]
MITRPDLNQLSLPLVLIYQSQHILALESRWVLGCHAFNGGQRMTLQNAAGIRYLHFCGDVEFIELPAPQLHPLPALMFARKTWSAVKALVEYRGQFFVLLDALLLEEDLNGNFVI